VTVCVATISLGTTIFGASDRMLTISGFQHYEPSPSKIVSLTSSICAMIAGDMRTQIDLLYETRRAILDRLGPPPSRWFNVSEAADIYASCCAERRFSRAENRILAPLNLDRNTFLSRQHELQPSFVKSLRKQLQAFEASPTPGANLRTFFGGVRQEHRVSDRLTGMMTSATACRPTNDASGHRRRRSLLS
jgi:hypothetical protein